MTNPIQATLRNYRHQNNGLFSDYFLDKIVPERLNQKLEMHNEAREVMDELRELLDNIEPETLDEAQLEEVWIKPILRKLGHHYGVQVKIRFRESGNRRPDYILMRNEDDAASLTNEIYTPDKIEHALAIADAKKWGVHLDQSGENQRNPSQQIDEYLRYSELTWGILTNGRIWRLYERESSKYNRYYSVDLLELLRSNDVDSFLYFYAFFRHEAFTGDWLEIVRKGSEEFARKLTDTLEDEVYDALVLIAQGFLDYRRNKLEPTPETLQTIYAQSLVRREPPNSATG